MNKLKSNNAPVIVALTPELVKFLKAKIEDAQHMNLMALNIIKDVKKLEVVVQEIENFKAIDTAIKNGENGLNE
jgi:hypothetical protein